nr:hypothetical protein [Tanacetum cinerariifolium]
MPSRKRPRLPTPTLTPSRSFESNSSSSHKEEENDPEEFLGLGLCLDHYAISPIPSAAKLVPSRTKEPVMPVLQLKKDQEKDKIGSKRDKNGKRSEAGKCQKQLQ